MLVLTFIKFRDTVKSTVTGEGVLGFAHFHAIGKGVVKKKTDTMAGLITPYGAALREVRRGGVNPAEL